MNMVESSNNQSILLNELIRRISIKISEEVFLKEGDNNQQIQ